MIAYLLLEPVLSTGENSATEAVISAVLERINRTDGSVCHEETIGDYATYLNQQDNITSTAPQYDYKMVDTDFFLPVVMKTYFVDNSIGKSRSDAFFSTKATIDPANAGLTYADLALISAEKVMNSTAPFAQPGGQIKTNLIHLKEGEIVGQWRDSTYGLGGGRIPYDVNTALVPAALRSIAALSAAGFFASHPSWNETASAYAQIWEDSTLAFFAVTVPQDEARDLVESYTQESDQGFPSNVEQITSDIVYHGVALDGNNDQSVVKVMNTDDCFRTFLLDAEDPQGSFINQTANNLLMPFPVGLSASVGAVVANPAYGGDAVYAANFSTNAYHGVSWVSLPLFRGLRGHRRAVGLSLTEFFKTVVWSWQLAMTVSFFQPINQQHTRNIHPTNLCTFQAAGLERQLNRCTTNSSSSSSSSNTTTTSAPPAFCSDTSVHSNVLAAYNHLWDTIEANSDILSSEVWSWVYEDGDFRFTPLGALPPPAGVNPTESNVRQLWSLTFLRVKRNVGLGGGKDLMG
jgi:hypothetical protein